MKVFYKICLVVLMIGGLNWGLIGIFQFDAIAWLCGGTAGFIARAIYTLCGISAICLIPSLFADTQEHDAHK